MHDAVGIGNKDGTYYVVGRDGVNEVTGVRWDSADPSGLPYWKRQVGILGEQVDYVQPDDRQIAWREAGFRDCRARSRDRQCQEKRARNLERHELHRKHPEHSASRDAFQSHRPHCMGGA